MRCAGGGKTPAGRVDPDTLLPAAAGANVRSRLAFLDRSWSTAVAVAVGLLQAVAGQARPADDRPRLPGGLGQGAAAALVDVDGDGDVDLLRAGPGGVAVLLQSAAGRFVQSSALGPLAAGETAVGIASGRLSPASPGPDFVVAVAGGPSLLARNRGGGAFDLVQPGPFPPRASTAAVQALVADVDGALRDDVVLLFDGAPAQLFIADATGAFTESLVGLPAFSLQSPTGALADLDRDGDADLIVAPRGTSAVPLLFLNDGTGRFVPVGFGATPFVVASLSWGDLDGDALPDLVFGEAGASSKALRIFRNLGGGQFRLVNPVTQFLVENPVQLHTRDLDGDRTIDVAVLQLDGRVRLGFNAGNAQLGAPLDVLGAADRRALQIGDLESDGDLDLCAIGRTAADELLLAAAGRAFRRTENITLPAPEPAEAGLAVLVDATGEGDPDIVVARPDGAGTVLVNDGAARFVVANSLFPALPPAGWRFAAAAAVDGPVADDLLLVGQRAGAPEIRVLVNRAPGFADESHRLPLLDFLAAPIAAAVGDFVRNAASLQRTDLVVADGSGMLWLLASQGTGFARPAAPIGPQRGPIVALLSGDLDGDDHLDLIVVEAAGSFSVLAGDSAGGFAPRGTVPVGVPLRAAVLGDADGDGRQDLLLVRPSTAVLPLLLFSGRGDGTLFDRSAALPAGLPGDIGAVAVLPGAHVALGDRAGRRALLFGAQGNGFTPPVPLELRGAGTVSRFLLEDLDVDGDEDVFVVHDDLPPAVLFGPGRQLQQTGLCQVGRPLALRIHGPPGGAAVVFLGASAFRFPLAPWGLLRLNPVGLVQLFSRPLAANGQVDVVLPTSINFLPVELPVQGAVLDAQVNIRFTNLEFLQLVRL
jgi:hypothetical protein